MKKKKVIALIGTIVILGAAGGAGYYFWDDIKEAVPFLQGTSSEDKVYVEKLSKVMNQSTGVSNRYNGIVESQDSYEVNVDSSRTIKEILVEVGDTVEEGQELVTYDTSEIEMQIKLAQLDLESINNDIASDQKKIETLNAEIAASTDEDEKFANLTEIQSIENSIEQNKLDLEAKNLEIEKYRNQLKDSSVVSKKSGVVKEINENGMNSSGDSAAFMTILQSGEYRVKGTIDEQNIWMINEGQSVVIRSRVDEEKIWRGKLQQIDKENVQKDDSDNYYGSSDTQSSTKYPFYVELDSAEGLLLGQHVYIEMDEGQEEVKEGIWLYSSYIVQDESGAYVWTANEKNRLEKRFVELGEYDGNLDEYEIVSGLAANDYISWPMAGLYEGVTTVTNMEEVDYSSPLYNQESTELLEDEYVGIGTELMEGDYTNDVIERGMEQIYDVDGTETVFPEELERNPLEEAEGTEVEE